ncbi:MAG: DUF1232 domain-containing protein [Acidobacteria bacterium]|nr:DUF1232 domain-containing protein [Acidobacteriota bacterium]
MVAFRSVKDWISRIKRDTVAVYFAARNPETPFLIRLLALAVASYALSPIDLIPDFIPVIGYLDDLILVPLGLVLVIRLLPPHVLAVSRVQAATALERPRGTAAAIVVVVVWLLASVALARWFARH